MSSVCFLSYLSTWATQVMFPRQLGQDNSADTQKEVNKCVKKVLTSKQWNASCFSPSFLTLPWHVIRCSTLGYSLCPTVHLIHNCWWSWLSPFEPLTSHVALSMYPPLFCVPLVKDQTKRQTEGTKGKVKMRTRTEKRRDNMAIHEDCSMFDMKSPENSGNWLGLF